MGNRLRWLSLRIHSSTLSYVRTKRLTEWHCNNTARNYQRTCIIFQWKVSGKWRVPESYINCSDWQQNWSPITLICAKPNTVTFHSHVGNVLVLLGKNCIFCRGVIFIVLLLILYKNTRILIGNNRHKFLPKLHIFKYEGIYKRSWHFKLTWE
jgi:hypothetical protein